MIVNNLLLLYRATITELYIYIFFSKSINIFFTLLSSIVYKNYLILDDNEQEPIANNHHRTL